VGSPYLPDFKDVATFRIIGVRRSGKSGLGETIAIKYLQNGSSVYDLYAANDNESLAWLDSPYSDRVILVRGAETTLDCNYHTMSIEDLEPKTAPDGRIFIMTKSFFANEELYYAALEKLTECFSKRDSWNRTHVILIREAQEWIAGRMKSGRPRGAKDSAEDFITFNNTLFHCGYAVITDSQRSVGVSKDVRELTTFLFMKTMGQMEIPDNLNWTMKYETPELMRQLPSHLFNMVGERGQFAIGWFLLPPWHIKRGTSIIERLGIRVSFDEKKTAIAMVRRRDEARKYGGRAPAIDEQMHRVIVAEHMGVNGSAEEPKGKSFREISLENRISEDSAKRQWKAHVMGVCSCKST